MRNSYEERYMMERDRIQAMLPKAFMGLGEGKREKHSGKVRDWYVLDD